MATNTAATVPAPRQDPRQVTNTLKKTVNFNDAGISSGVAFDAVTTNVLTVGTNSTTFNNLVQAADVDEGTTGGRRQVDRPLEQHREPVVPLAAHDVR